MPLRRLEEMEAILQSMIALNRNLRTKGYRKLVLYNVPKKHIRVPYTFYLN